MVVTNQNKIDYWSEAYTRDNGALLKTRNEITEFQNQIEQIERDAEAFFRELEAFAQIARQFRNSQHMMDFFLRGEVNVNQLKTIQELLSKLQGQPSKHQEIQEYIKQLIQKKDALEKQHDLASQQLCRLAPETYYVLMSNENKGKLVNNTQNDSQYEEDSKHQKGDNHE